MYEGLVEISHAHCKLPLVTVFPLFVSCEELCGKFLKLKSYAWLHCHVT